MVTLLSGAILLDVRKLNLVVNNWHFKCNFELKLPLIHFGPCTILITQRLSGLCIRKNTQ